MFATWFPIAVGFCFMIRIAEELRRQKLLEMSALTKIGTGYFIMCGLGASAGSESRFMLCVWVFIPVIALSLSEFWIRGRRSRQFRGHFVTFLSTVLLHMKSGRSFREAVKSANHEMPKFFRKKMELIFENVVFSQHSVDEHHHGFTKDVIEEFRRIDSGSASAIKRLASFREKLRVEDDFRRRSGRILLQIRLQSLIMSGLFLALILADLHLVGWTGIKNVIWPATSLFATGVALTFLMGRKIRWNI